MPDLATQIREYVDAVDPPVTVQDVQEILDVGGARLGSTCDATATDSSRSYRRGSGRRCHGCCGSCPGAGDNSREPPPSSVRDGAGRYRARRSVPKRSSRVLPNRSGSASFRWSPSRPSTPGSRPDGSGRQRIDVTGRHLLVPSDRGAWVAAGSPSFGPPLGVTEHQAP